LVRAVFLQDPLKRIDGFAELVLLLRCYSHYQSLLISLRIRKPQAHDSTCPLTFFIGGLVESYLFDPSKLSYNLGQCNLVMAFVSIVPLLRGFVCQTCRHRFEPFSVE
jgi:hypothetical protein